MSVNAGRDDIFRIAEHFVTKHGMVMQRHEPEGHVEKYIKKLFTISKVKVTAGAYIIKI